MAATAESRRLTAAFVASSQLRPMAQQLNATRSPAAYSGVSAYASTHSGEAAAAAQLALGHAYRLDHRYADAEQAYQKAGLAGTSLHDYADFLGAQAAIEGNRAGDAVPLLTGFSQRYPDSIFVTQSQVLLASVYNTAGNPGAAVALLAPLAGTPAAHHADFRLVLAKAYAASGNSAAAAAQARAIYLEQPLSGEAAAARTLLLQSGAPLTPAERKQHADALFNAKHYELAGAEYRGLSHDATTLNQADKDALEIYAAVCDLRLKRLSRSDVGRLPVTNDDSAALKLYLESELARGRDDFARHDELVTQLTGTYPHSRWLEEALFSGGNMYQIKHDPARSIADYTALVEHFPRSMYAPAAHWRAAWQSYRLHRYPEAARLMDAQITAYTAGQELPGAMYWRGRMLEDQENNPGQALNYYEALSDRYPNSYYAMLARQRVSVLGRHARPEPAPALAAVVALPAPDLIASPPENDPHLIKARLLANAALNEFIQPEIAASPTSGGWGALAEADIYSSFGETTRALQSMKHSGLPFTSLPVSEVPHTYWTLLFPRPYWEALQADAKMNGLDPYLVAALIRQESEFNPGAVSRANAYGLMQLLPSTGKGEAKKAGLKHFNASELLNPTTNLQLGTQDLRRSLDHYNGQVEYALASYNAGDVPVRNWIAYGDYKDVPEWVESIPYSETRDYVQSILRNRELYRAIYGASPTPVFQTTKPAASAAAAE